MKDILLKGTFLLILLIAFYSCKKDNSAANGSILPGPPAGVTLSYGDSIFFLENQAADYKVLPINGGVGEYSGFPDGIDLDSKTGEINISKSETGLRYRITFVPSGTTDSISTVVVISGINFLDGFYKLTTTDSVILPLYNANQGSAIPGINNGTLFDEGSGCNSAGCNVDISAGSINLAQTVRNGVFGTTPSNNDRHEFQLNYRINDQSSKSLNTIRVKLYYFDSISDVTQEAYDIIASRQGALFGVQPRPVTFERFITSVNSITAVNTKAPPKPRPPCIFILGR